MYRGRPAPDQHRGNRARPLPASLAASTTLFAAEKQGGRDRQTAPKPDNSPTNIAPFAFGGSAPRAPLGRQAARCCEVKQPLVQTPAPVGEGAYPFLPMLSLPAGRSPPRARHRAKGGKPRAPKAAHGHNVVSKTALHPSVWCAALTSAGPTLSEALTLQPAEATVSATPRALVHAPVSFLASNESPECAGSPRPTASVKIPTHARPLDLAAAASAAPRAQVHAPVSFLASNESSESPSTPKQCVWDSTRCDPCRLTTSHGAPRSIAAKVGDTHFSIFPFFTPHSCNDPHMPSDLDTYEAPGFATCTFNKLAPLALLAHTATDSSAPSPSPPLRPQFLRQATAYLGTTGVRGSAEVFPCRAPARVYPEPFLAIRLVRA